MAQIAVLVPTLRRADKLEAIAENVHAATKDPRLVFIAEHTDLETVEALHNLKDAATCIIGDYGSCAAAMNAGYRGSTEPFVFTSNDDILLHEGWDEAALAVMSDTTHIVGTNDGNGRMTCFALARRAYIEAESGVFDKPNTLWHEYTSQYPDTELADYAKFRGVWGEAPDSLTLHQHWEFGLADPDHPNYLKAKATVAADHAIYAQRRHQWESEAA